ncbi:helix-turn-helix domain-containing protein [Aquabacterium sp. UBA2148]|uniref:helix-turn-helix domain-containing protein n=1 Tax=Aquabacterium sp. UBA2148 TaxID=1946042 RepID=UPI00257AF9A4|nr:helix-turn-helix domain-containing protein [Aquabacterium sp. UBA2148]
MSKIRTPPPWVLRTLASLGERCKIARKARSLTQAQLASLADVGTSTIYAVEGGNDGVSIGNFMKILHALDQLEQFEEILDPSRDPMITEFAVRKLSPGSSHAP